MNEWMNEESWMRGKQTCPLTIHFNMWTASSDVSIQRLHWQPLSVHLWACCSHPAHDVNDAMSEGWPQHRGLRLYSTANDPQPQMIPRQQMIPKMDRKWSSTASDPESRPQMIPWKLEEWNGFYGTDDKKGLIIKKETFFSRLLNKDGRRPGRYISGQFIQGEKKKWNKSEKVSWY